MFKNYLKTALRNIVRYKSYSFINIAGLAVGMACCIMIILWIQDELSYENFNKNLDNLYRMYQKQVYSGNQLLHTDNLPGVLAEELMATVPEVSDAARYLVAGNSIVENGDNRHFERGILFTDPSFFHMFTFPLIEGDKDEILIEPFSIVLTEETAHKYFGEENPVGKNITIDNKYDFEVTGVLHDIPHNTHIGFDFVVPFARTKELLNTEFNRWGWNWPRTYVLLDENSSHTEFAKKIEGILGEHSKGEVYLYAQPVKDINLYSISGRKGYIIYIYIFSGVAFLILLIACINFMNLSTARSNLRAKEVGIRKVSGAFQHSIIFQFLGESLLMSLLSLMLAVVLVEMFLPVFNNILNTKMSLDVFGNYRIIMMLIVISVTTGLISGSYPALVFSSLQPVKIIKGAAYSGSGKATFRNTLVLFQFAVSIALIISTVVIYFQVNYIKNRDLGYREDHLVYIDMLGDSREKYETIKNEFLKNPNVVDVTATSILPLYAGNNTGSLDWEGKRPDQSVLINCVETDYNYIEAMGMEMASGRALFKQKSADSEGTFEYILNETAIAKMEMESPVGKRFGSDENTGTIIGVVKDFHFASMKWEIAPMLIRANLQAASIVLVRINSPDMSDTIERLKSTWKELNPVIPMSYGFIDERIERLYRTDHRIGKLANYFTFLTIFVACLGLLGLASFTAQQRTKEIGIRKVLGASVASVVLLLSKELTKWILIANLIAWPIAYYTMNNWLQGFAYRISISPWVFLLSGAAALVTAIFTISYQALKAATANPVKSLKYE